MAGAEQRPGRRCANVGGSSEGQSGAAGLKNERVPVLGTTAEGVYRIRVKSVHTPEYQALLDWLRKARQAKGLTMREMAARLHVPHSWIGKVETGERRIDVVELARLCRVLDIDVHAGVDIVARIRPYASAKTAVIAYAADSHKPWRGESPNRPAGQPQTHR